ncbi:MAG TPA: hypothetical protein VK978_00780, partial [Candidatus Saccharimonadales bacterium]|nr:hypothetical protein [Candidatus Saccharimonadales bacterium]
MSVSTARPTLVFKSVFVSFALAATMVLAANSAVVSAANVTFNSARDCDTNAIVRCGAMSVDELQQKYTADGKAQTVYGTYNISADDVTNMDSTAVAGSVTKSGDVVVNGRVVANNAVSAGYNDGTGRTSVTQDGVTFYNSAPSSSFVSDRIDAYVVMNEDGQFDYAILASCGNPVRATNVVQKQAPAPQPTQA